MTEQQAQLRLASLCAKGEHCTQEMLEKLRKWEIEEDAQARVKDKIQYNGWGRRKVEQALYMKGIPRSVSDPILDEIPDEMYLEKLRPLIKHKWPTIKARNEYERSMKLIKFAMGRGFDVRLIRQCIDDADELLND